MGRQVTLVLYVMAMVAVIVGVDFAFFRNRFWERLAVNFGIRGSLACRACRPHAPFAELVGLSRTSLADELREDHTRRVLGE